MNRSLTLLERVVLRAGTSARLNNTPCKIYLNPNNIRRPLIFRHNSTQVPSKEFESAQPQQPEEAQVEDKTAAETLEPEKEEKTILDGIKEHIKKVPKRIDGSRIRKDRVDNETATAAANESLSIPRKLRKAEKQKRQEAADRPQKSQAQKSLRRVGSDAGLRREVVEALIQQAKTRQVRAYCVAEAFSFPKLRHLLGDHGYYPFTALSEDCIHVTSEIEGSELGDIFFFMDGTVVTWGLSEDESLRLLEQIKPAEMEPYKDIEEEELDFVHDSQLRTGIVGETIIIGRDESKDENGADSHIGADSPIYAKLAFSNGIARSTKLAVLEEQLDNYLDSTREIPRILARGNKLPWGRQKTLQKVGEILAFRGELNLHSELVETPDLYWAMPQLEEYYNRISKKLDVAVRITILNKKLDYANELAATLRSHLSEKHGLALEWGIIGLIAIEVVFGIIELVK